MNEVPKTITKLQLASLIQNSKKSIVVKSATGQTFDVNLKWLSHINGKRTFQTQETNYEILIHW